MKLRAPAVPLVTYDPYFSIWSMSDSLNDDPTKALDVCAPSADR